ncbi:MAG: PBP1A family penicillin-binding protein [Deltaproteobacteria bacterium]|nr:PBP1A family penicillin-binding protein [Deltaproteobacteria bacterium]
MYSRYLKISILVFFLPAVLGVGFAYSLVNYLEIPDVKQLETFTPKSTTRLYADDGTLFAELFVEKRVPIPLSEMPNHLKHAFIAVEDVRFYRHFGIDLRGILRAAYNNLTKGRIVEGASTITQQLARNLYLSPKKTLKRKIEEAILAIQIERTYSKDEILGMYLNLIYLGEGCYGVEAASYAYFGKKAKDLTLEESATLAALTKSPSKLSPFKNPDKVLSRRNFVLKKMYEAGFIDRKQFEKAIFAPLNVVPQRMYEKKTGYFTDYVKYLLEDQLDKKDGIYTSGMNIRTTLNLKMTEYGYEAISKGLKLYKDRHPNVKELPEVALIAVEIKTGDIKVLIGGKDFLSSPFNRVFQAKRQPGSAFKPIIYLAALEQGFSPNHVLLDSPISYRNPYTGKIWQPKNYKNEYYGYVPMKKALELSLNTATVRLLEMVGIDNTLDMAKRLGIKSDIESNLSIALGTCELSPIELAEAYLTVARMGSRLPLRAILEVTDVNGETIYKSEKKGGERVVDSKLAYELVKMMEGVIKNGTAKKASSMPYSLAGKTGTTDDFRDAWFVGFSSDLLCLVWVGYDKDRKLGSGESGAQAALPIWIEFMSKALPMYENKDFGIDLEDFQAEVWPSL